MRFCLFLMGLAPLFSAEPHRILFNRIGPYEARLFVANADGSEEHPLLQSTSLDYNPAWSPDGQWIVFTSERDGSADLYRVRRDGSGLQRLTDHPAYDDQAAFSPDGKQLVFVTTRAGGTADLWTLDVETRKAKPLTSGAGGDFRPAWSPDGKWIAFSSDRGSTLPMAKGRWEHLHIVDVYLIRPDGSGLKRLTEHGNFCGSPKWSADSRRVVAYCMSAEETWTYRSGKPAAGETRLVSIDTATGAIEKVDAGPGVKLSPTMLRSGEIAYIRKDTGAPGVFYGNGKPGPAGAIRSPSWSPDGARVVYHKILSTEARDWEKTWSRDAKYDLIFTRWLPAFDPSGERFVATRSSNGALELIASGVNTAHTLYQQEGKTVMAAQWSPKGDAIIFGLGFFFTNRDRGAQVALLKPDGSGFRQLTSGANNNGFPSLSPDGKRFVYRTVGPDGQGLRIMNLEDSAVTTLTSDYDNFPLWSPRGDLIIFTRKFEGDFEVFSIRPNGKDLRRLTYSPGNEGHCTFSPDGEWIVFSSTRMGFKDEALYTDSPQPYGELFVMRYDGSGVQQLTDNQWEDATPAWQPELRVRSAR
jgi:TolB protein